MVEKAYRYRPKNQPCRPAAGRIRVRMLRQPVRIDRFVAELVRHRDDAHIAAWQPSGLDGKTWEALTLIWRAEAASAAELSDRLSGHGYG